MTSYWLHSCGTISKRAEFFLNNYFKGASGAQPAGTGVKRPECESDLSLLFSSEVKLIPFPT